LAGYDTYGFFFIDIVGFSRGTDAAQQREKITALNAIIQRSLGEPVQEVACLPTGDGALIAFPGNMQRPYELAVAVHHGLAEYNRERKRGQQILVRIGLHMGEAFHVRDITGNDNICGPGIVIARRLMDSADPGHILASKQLRDALVDLHRVVYQPRFRDLGKLKAKWDTEIHVFNVRGEGFGKRSTPIACAQSRGRTWNA
jgi:class 3 adenylate cyclase